MNRTESGWINLLKELYAYWRHDGNSENPHAILTSRNHSNGFCNCSFIIEDPMLLKAACEDLIEKGRLAGVNFDEIQRVYGSANGATDVSLMMGMLLGVKRGFTEKQPDGSMKLKRFKYPKGTKILLCEDVMSTGETNTKTIDELENHDGIVLPWIFVFCNRSGKKDLDGRKIISLIDKEMPMWPANECPLCKDGSKAIRAKENWDELTASC